MRSGATVVIGCSDNECGLVCFDGGTDIVDRSDRRVEIVDHAVSFVNGTKFPALAVEEAAKVSHMADLSWSVPEAEKFVRKLISWGHESPLEFASITLKIRTSRDITHELVRHRLASYCQESTRYVAYTDNIQVIRSVTLEKGSASYDMWESAVALSSKMYRDILKTTGKAEIARTVLTGSTATSIMVQMNMREFRHFLKLRLSKSAHPDMRQVAKLCKTVAEEHGFGVFLEDMPRE